MRVMEQAFCMRRMVLVSPTLNARRRQWPPSTPERLISRPLCSLSRASFRSRRFGLHPSCLCCPRHRLLPYPRSPRCPPAHAALRLMGTLGPACVTQASMCSVLILPALRGAPQPAATHAPTRVPEARHLIPRCTRRRPPAPALVKSRLAYRPVHSSAGLRRAQKSASTELDHIPAQRSTHNPSPPRALRLPGAPCA